MTSNRKGMTLVEVLVNIAIIGLLISLLLPAIQAARESARRTQCADHFRQVGLGMQNYLAAKQVFPTGLFHWEGIMLAPDDTCARPPEDEEPIQDQDYAGWGWGTFLLPYIEEQAVYDQFDFKRGPNGHGVVTQSNLRAAARFISLYLCPSDPQGEEGVGFGAVLPPGELANATGEDADFQGIGRTNMVGVMGYGVLNRPDGHALPNTNDKAGWNCIDLGSPTNAPRSNANGMLYNRSKVSAGDVADGLSHTLLVGEARGAVRGFHLGYFWVTWDVAVADKGINVAGYLQQPNRYPWKDAVGDDAGGFSSYHPGGCHFVLCDGSVQFLADAMSQDTLRAMSTRKGGETIELE